MHTATDKTLHTEDPHHIEVFPGITVAPDHVHHTNTALTEQPGRTKIGNINKSPLMTHPPKYYTSDEQASKSDDYLN